LSTPKCSRLSLDKLATLVHQPKTYFDPVGSLDAGRIHYGVPNKIANQVPPSVASGKIRYYPSLMVSATRALRRGLWVGRV
jgi:hypothetical protein